MPFAVANSQAIAANDYNIDFEFFNKTEIINLRTHSDLLLKEYKQLSEALSKVGNTIDKQLHNLKLR